MGATLADALRAGGLPVDVVAAAELPPVDRLATYSSTVLVDVDAHSLSNDQVASLTVATRDLGRGLVAVGGDRSFALGGYLDSELEKLLPVISDIKDPLRRPSVAEVLAIDSSGSMGACHCSEGGGANGLMGGNPSGGGVNKTDISRAAAARTISALAADDHVGVLAFNTEQAWIVPLQQLPAEDVVTEGLRQLSPAGGTDLSAAPAGGGRGPAQRQGQAQAHHPVHRRLHQPGRPRRRSSTRPRPWPRRASPCRSWPPARRAPTPAWPPSPTPGGAASTTRPTSARSPRS